MLPFFPLQCISDSMLSVHDRVVMENGMKQTKALRTSCVIDFEVIPMARLSRLSRRSSANLPKHSGPYPLSLEDRFNLWYRPIFGGRRKNVRLLTAAFYPLAWMLWSISRGQHSSRLIRLFHLVELLIF